MEGISVKMGLIYAVLMFVSLHSFVASDSQGDALYALRTSLNALPSQLSDWNPNQDSPCAWSNVICDSNYVISVTLSAMGFSGTLTPRIAVLNSLRILSMQGNGITGGIPEEFGNLSSLTSLKLGNNRLTGQIPSTLGNLKKLQFLILSQNNLNGSIPESIVGLPNMITLELDSNHLSGQVPEQLFQVQTYNLTGNHLNCGVNFSHRCESDSNNTDVSKKSKLGMIFGIIGALICLLLGGLLFHVWKNKRRDVFVDVSGKDDPQIPIGDLKRFAWRELQLATDDFSEKNVIGKGGFGKVYKGKLADGREIAVKRLTDCASPASEATFQSEVEMISVAVHRNLLRLIGFCTTSTERLLVYPFMHNLSVACRLRELKPGEQLLDWGTRKRVAIGTARGLEYLHEHCNPRIIHRDVKAANVLLDEDFEAVVGDFGLAKLVDVKKSSVTTEVRGTVGHIAPEYHSTKKASVKTDVFGYGIMLMELVTGLRAIDFSRSEDDGIILLDYVKKLEREKKLNAIVDRNLNRNADSQEVEKMIQVAILCTQASPFDRPIMSEVRRMLEGEGLTERWEEWQQVEVCRRQERERLQRRFDMGEDSVYNQSAIELSDGR